jgi:hypothetical protein
MNFLTDHTYNNMGGCTEQVKWTFVEEFADSEALHCITVWQLINQFCETISVLDALRSGRL